MSLWIEQYFHSELHQKLNYGGGGRFGWHYERRDDEIFFLSTEAVLYNMVTVNFSGNEIISDFDIDTNSRDDSIVNF